MEDAKVKVETAEVLREYGPYPNAPKVNGVTFDGRLVWLAVGHSLIAIAPDSGEVARSLAIPAQAGSAFDGRYLYQLADDVIQKIEQALDLPNHGAIVRTLQSDRYVTGVTWLKGELWHGTLVDDTSELHEIDPQTGALRRRIALPQGTVVSGLESNGTEGFFCGGAGSGKLRAVRRSERRT